LYSREIFTVEVIDMARVGDVRVIMGKRVQAYPHNPRDACNNGCVFYKRDEDCVIECDGVIWKLAPQKQGIPTRETLEVGDIIRSDRSCVDRITGLGEEGYLFRCSEENHESHNIYERLVNFTYYQKPVTNEYTIQEVADKMGVPAESVRIKDN